MVTCIFYAHFTSHSLERKKVLKRVCVYWTGGTLGKTSERCFLILFKGSQCFASTTLYSLSFIEGHSPIYKQKKNQWATVVLCLEATSFQMKWLTLICLSSSLVLLQVGCKPSTEKLVHSLLSDQGQGLCLQGLSSWWFRDEDKRILLSH